MSEEEKQPEEKTPVIEPQTLQAALAPPERSYPLEAELRPWAEGLRKAILGIEAGVDELRLKAIAAIQNMAIADVLLKNGKHGPDVDRVMRNIDLVIEHLEDARMRLGKVLQHARDGVSIYDQKPAGG